MVEMLEWLSLKITHKLNDNAWLFTWALISIVGLFSMGKYNDNIFVWCP